MYIGYDRGVRRRFARSCAPTMRDAPHGRGPRGTGAGRTAPARVDAGGCAADGRRTAGSGIGWPTEYGGQGRSEIEQFVFFDESMRARRAGAHAHDRTPSVPTLMNITGAPEQKAFFLPRILAGELHFCIGYSRGGRRHGPRVAHDARRARRRRVRHQRPEALDEPGGGRGLLLARGADGSGRAEARRALDVPGRGHEDRRASVSTRSSCSRTTTSTRCSSTTCGCPATDAGRRGLNRGWESHHRSS